MKELSTLLILLISSMLLQAQGGMSVQSFKALPNDLDAVDAHYEKFDFNGEPAAIIKVVTKETGFTFDVGVMGVVATEQHVGEVWVYVPHSIQRITIKHPSLGVLRDYYLPVQIEKARVYELQLHSGNITQVVHQDAVGQYVILDIDPKVAGVSIGGAETEYITDGYYEKFLPYGEHNISISASMYKTHEGVINVSGEKVEQTISLQPNFGSLHIDANVSGAEVYIDDVPKGTTPYSMDRLAFGTYNLMVFKDNYVAERFTLNISEARQYTKNVTLRKNTADISISCSLQETDIYIAGKHVGTAPWRGELAAGTHKIEARKEGHRATLKTITVQRGIPQTVQIDAPTPKYGSLNVSANQRDVQVYVDDALLGSAPNIFSNVLEGRHKITFKKEGYEDNEQILEVKEGGVFAVRGEMKEKPKYTNQTFTVKGVSFTMVFVEGGMFGMGSNSGYEDEKPVHRVEVSNFYIGKYEVTQAEYQAVMGTNPSHFKGDNLPVEQVSWYDAIEYCNALSVAEGLTPYYIIDKTTTDPNNTSSYDNVKWTVTCNTTSKGYRLPTEAEWEYAAKGGNQSQGYTYSGSNTVGDVAWYHSNSNSRTHAVGTKAGNELGIHDMSGNVYEWCWDWYGIYSSTAESNPQGPASGEHRVARGGSWLDDGGGCRTAHRGGYGAGYGYDYLGFRIARSL